MAKLAIPERYLAGVRDLLALDDASVNLISEKLGDVPAESSTRSLAMAVRPAIQNIASNRVYQMLKALKALYGVRSNSGTPLIRFVNDLIEAIQEVNPEDIPEGKADAIRRRLKKLLGVKAVSLYSKMQTLQASDERTFCRARVQTDLRPIFADGAKAGPQAFVVSHRLQLGYHQDGSKHRDFYLTLDAGDLDALKRVIEQAEKESESLQSFLSRFTTEK